MSELQRRALPRTQRIAPNGLDMDMQIWRDINDNQLKARFASARNRGYVIEVTPMKRTKRGDFAMVVKVLKPIPRKTPWYVLVVVASAGASVSIGLAIWHARQAIVTGLGTLAAIVFLLWLATRVSHSGTCVGIHCPGCKSYRG
jgi:hypothetical protein